MSTEADTCRKYVRPKLQAAGWEKVAENIAVSFNIGTVCQAAGKSSGSEGRARHSVRAALILGLGAPQPYHFFELNHAFQIMSATVRFAGTNGTTCSV
jgi:hypothetical protein